MNPSRKGSAEPMVLIVVPGRSKRSDCRAASAPPRALAAHPVLCFGCFSGHQSREGQGGTLNGLLYPTRNFQATTSTHVLSRWAIVIEPDMRKAAIARSQPELRSKFSSKSEDSEPI